MFEVDRAGWQSRGSRGKKGGKPFGPRSTLVDVANADPAAYVTCSRHFPELRFCAWLRGP